MFFVYRTSDGVLVSIGSTVADPLPAGLAAIERPAMTATEQWDATARDVVPRTVAPVRTIDKSEFLRRLTLTSLAAILAREGSDPLVAALRLWIDNVTRVDLDTVEVQQGIGYLQSIGVITATHAAAILADGAA